MLIKPELNELIEWLQKSDRNRFEVYNVDNNSTLEKCVSYSDLSKNGATVEDYFTKLVGKGIKTVQINTKQKHGSTFIRDGCSHNYGIGKSNDNVAASGSQANKPGATLQQSNGLGSPASFGLGAPEILTMSTQASRYNDAAEDNRRLTLMNDRLIEENKVLTNDNITHKLTNQFTNDHKPSSLDKLIDGLATNPAAITQIIGAFKPGSVPGLNAPVGSKLSDSKNTMVDLISNNAQVTDRHAEMAYYVIAQSLTGNEAFINDYLKILQEHKIIANGSDNTNYSNT